MIISEELCFVSHQYWSYHIVSLLPGHYSFDNNNKVMDMAHLRTREATLVEYKPLYSGPWLGLIYNNFDVKAMGA